MTEPFVAEISLVAFTFAPRGWALCNGQLMPISQNTALFSLLGTTYGGDGRTTFALPDLQGRVAVHTNYDSAPTRYLGETGGSASVTLTSTELPAHTHTLRAMSAYGTSARPDGRSIAIPRYGRVTDAWFAPEAAAGAVQMSAASVGDVGSGLAHNNMPPYLGILHVIALQGVFPQRP